MKPSHLIALLLMNVFWAGTYTAFKAQVDLGRVQARAIQGNPSFMPASGKLPNCNIQQLQAWIDAGALNN